MNSDIGFAGNIGKILSFNEDVPYKGVEVIDHIERRRCQIKTSTTVSPKEVSTKVFDFPVDRGGSIISDSISIPHTMAVYVRNHAGIMIEELTKGDEIDLPFDDYSIEFSAPVKLYIAVESDMCINVTSEKTKIEFDGLRTVQIGVRSHHERPAAKMTTTTDPKSMMRVISHLGSSLKTMTCERSYPTLRGHPPEIELGDKVHIPDVIEKPETNIKIETCENHRSIYSVAPLAYYFGAEVVPGDSHRIVTKDGFTHRLDRPNISLEKKIGQVLKQCFFLDCSTRTEGYYKIKLHEREQIEEKVNLDFPTLYNNSPSEQLEKYLQVSYEIIEPHLPQWKLTAHMEMDPTHIKMIPFLVNDLAIIRSAEETVTRRSKSVSSSQDEREKPTTDTDLFNENIDQSKGTLRGASSKDDDITQTRGSEMKRSIEYIDICENDTLEQAWIGNGIPVGASKAMVEAFKNRFKRSPTDGDIDITVVMNDEGMIEEGDIIDNIYDSREKLSFSVEDHQKLTTDELQNILHEETDFFHYIGHIDDNGFECTDGQLDVTKMNETGVDAFLLNACSSYKQAIGLVKAGATAGIATLRPVLNSGAERIGKAIARLLNLGFPLIAALEISKSESIMGENYVVIGDGGVDLTQPKSGIPSLCEISKRSGSNKVSYWTYATRRKDLGSITIPYVENNKEYFLTSGHTGEFIMEDRDLIEFLSMGDMPIKMESILYWSNENEFIKDLDTV